MHKLKLLFPLILLVIFACHDEKDTVYRECEESIVGEWIWLRSEGGIIESLNPENTGWNIRLEVGDSIWREFRNDTLIFDDKYVFEQSSDTIFYRGRIRFENHYPYNIKVINCTLYHDGVFDDSPDFIYERKE